MTTKIRIGETRWIGEGEPTFIIAEMGSNHNKNMAQAKELIDVAAACRVDAVKFQIYSADTLYPKSSRTHAILQEIEINREWLAELTDYVVQRGLIPLATPFDYAAVDQMAQLGMPAYKWASPEIHDLPLLRYATQKGKPIILSTGMCDLTDIQEAIKAVERSGNVDLVLLHCVSLYPTPPEHTNLRMMDTLKAAFHRPVGFSDHTEGIAVPIAAVARGATVIEKHYTLSRQLPGPDHAFAIEPKELADMVTAIRNVERSLGSPIKSHIQGQEDVRLNSRSIVSLREIPKGTTLSRDLVTVKRSADGIPPKFFDVVIGRKAVVDIRNDAPITWDMV